MTSRPAAQRSLSGNNNSNNNVLQRPAQQHRSLSQQYPTASPTRRSNDSFVDLTLEPSDVVQNRYGGSNVQSRMGGSRLKLEITQGSRNTAAAAVNSPRPALNALPPAKPLVPLRGRPLLHTDVSMGGGDGEMLSTGSTGQVHGEVLMVRHMPMPIRPGQHAPVVISKPKVALGTAVKKDARPKPYNLEVPAAAPHYSPNGHADFFPWTGNHPEDQFSEAVIRQGFFDKMQMTQNEHGSAKASIFPALKHKSGLQTLSSLFTGVLAQRRAYGQINSNSTFKPPPRVTVTDTKREIWLRDLANPTISLRRLSRSIPHGIRGKVLLEQSLSKNIPVERAVWLAKCVGANELRSFRRKGTGSAFAMSSEAKWIRDFTVCVEQFLEGIISSCAEKDFKNRINYAIRLSTHFHVECLLDREHYLDWLVSSLENSPQAKLPMWLLVVQIYWADLLQYRKHARRLSAALLAHFAETSSLEDQDLLGPLTDRLKLLITRLVKSNPESFVCPKVWSKYHKHLQSANDEVDERFSFSILEIEHRNRQLAAQEMESQPSIRQRLVQQLDKLLEQPFTAELPVQFWQMSQDKSILVRTVLEWSTSAHRPGAVKVFIGSRIMRAWGQLGLDITDAILDFIDPVVHVPGLSQPDVYHLISELARSEHFSTPIYFQWLIARGGLNQASELDHDAFCATRLLAELPTHALSDSMLSLRRTLLHRASFDVDEEEESLQNCMALIHQTLPRMRASLDFAGEFPLGDSKGSILSILTTSSRTIQSEIGLWLRKRVRLETIQAGNTLDENWDSFPAKGGVSSMTVSHFSTVRKYLECIGDYSMLADVLKIVTSSNDADVLASVADSINLHLETFAAIGATRDLFEILLARLPSFAEEQGSLPRVLLASMSSLAARMPDQNLIANQLTQELAQSDRKTAADACSPVSDHMAGVLQSEEADFTDEIEKVLASGTSMDQSTLERLFTKIMTRFEESWGRSNEQQRSCGLLLTRLKTFDAIQFDHLMVSWVHRFQRMGKRPTMAEVFAPLISFGCLDLKVIISAAEENIQIGVDDPTSLRTAHEALVLAILPTNMPEVMTAEETYRLRVKQLYIQRNWPIELLHLIRHALQASILLSKIDTQLSSNTLNLLWSHEARDVLQSLVIRNTEATTKHLVLPLCQSSNIEAAAVIESLIDSLLLAGRKMQFKDVEMIPAEAILDLASDLTLPFCQLKLASILNSDASGSLEREGAQNHRLEAFEEAIELTVAAGNTTWTSLVPLLDVSVAQHLRSRAESQFIALFPTTKSCISNNQWPTSDHVIQARNLLAIITATAHGNPVAGTILATDIVGVLNNMWTLLTNPHYTDLKYSIITDWLPLLVSFTTIHNTAFDLSKPGHELRAKALLAIAALMLEITTSDPKDMKCSLAEQMFDLSLLLVDMLSDDMRNQCIRNLRDAISDPRLQYIFSFARNSSDWLMLSQKDKAVPLVGGSAGLGTSVSANGPADIRVVQKEKLSHFPLRRWEMLGVGSGLGCDNDTSLSLTLFGARKS